LLGVGYKFEHPLRAMGDGQPVDWAERVQVVRSRDLARRQAATREKHLAAAEAELWAVTPVPGRGKRQLRDEAALQAAIARVVARHDVAGLLMVTWERYETIMITIRAAVGMALLGPPVPRCRSATPSLAYSGTSLPWRPGSIGWTGGSRSPMPSGTTCPCRKPCSTIGGTGRWNGTFLWSKTFPWASDRCSSGRWTRARA
jgi:hypothetical protein